MSNPTCEPPQTLRWVGDLPGHVLLIEQTKLPVFEELEVHDVPGMVDAIRRLAVRGAPAIGVAAGFGVLLGVQSRMDADADRCLQETLEDCSSLAASRPTAVNLFWALERMERAAKHAHAQGLAGADFARHMQSEALAIYESDRRTCRLMGEAGAELIQSGMTLLTHCNAGALATAGMGTALAPMYVAHGQGKQIAVFADETRPLLQGARITAWELHRAGIDVTVITDGMASKVMQEGRIDAIFVGSDRIAANGDVCNKIGTYGLALSAKHHGVPFYVVAPISTVDLSLESGAAIPIEERERDEIACGLGKQTVPDGVKVYNPAFDVTPAAWVTALITEAGVLHAPDGPKLRAAVERAQAMA
ncbi:MAG: S-methyl-5-thioribose-1-phosphate isomerase [Planctomycetes bacterium]|nr:S-methyl-5-thioribose-1-phosphate isomerase [Planctomycetota bacterium]